MTYDLGSWLAHASGAVMLLLTLLGAPCGCAKEPPPLPRVSHSNEVSPPRLAPATPSSSAPGAFIHRGPLAGANDAGQPQCLERGAPYPSQVERVLLRSARTPFVRFEVEGYVRSCLERATVEVQVGETWSEVAARPPRAPDTSLDGTPIAGEMCDVVSCMKIEHPACVPLVEVRKLDPQTNAYESRPLHGELRVKFPYYSDSDCHSAKLAEQRVQL
jgi:hypothetical protein